MKQLSEEWFAARRGKITCSRMAEVLAKSEAYADRIAAELLGEITVSQNFKAGQWGNDNEPKARAAYELANSVDVQEVGFFIHPDFPYVGGSPDGFVGDDGLIEIKCPANQKVHVSNRMLGVNPSYIAQIQGLLWVTDREWCDFISFDPRVQPPFDLYVERLTSDTLSFERIEMACVDFWRMIREGRRQPSFL